MLELRIHFEIGPCLKDLLTGRAEQLDRIERKIDTVTQEARDAWAAIDAETTRIANALEAALKDDPEALAKVQNHLAQLKAIGVNPNVPIPTSA